MVPEDAVFLDIFSIYAMQWLTWLSLNLFAHARRIGTERANEGLCHVSHKPSGKDIRWQNPSNKIGKNTQKLRRIIKYSLDIFAHSKHIQIIGKIPTIAF